MHVGRRICSIRQERGLSQESVAKSILSRSHYSNMETGRFNISTDILELLSQKLEVPITYLTNYKNENIDLNLKLEQLESALEDKEYKKVEQLILHIENEYEYIENIIQEFKYFLLKASYYIITNNIKLATSIIEKKINPYVQNEEDIPNDLLFYYYYTFAHWHQKRESFSKSREYYYSAIAHCQTIKERAKIFYNTAIVERDLHSYRNSINFAKRALEAYKIENMWYQVSKTYALLGLVYLETGLLEEAEDTLTRGLNITTRNQYSDLEEYFYENLGLVFDNQSKKELSIEYFKKSIEIKKRLKSQYIVHSYINLIETYMEIDKIKEAKEFLKEVKQLDKDRSEKYLVMETEAKIALLSNSKEKYESLTKKVIDYYIAKKNWLFLIPLAKQYSEYLAANFKYKDAYMYSKIALDASDNVKKGGVSIWEK
ncbi:helix-turn-helix domain-containing protein [Evansella sp. AB-P1]|uniref:helix-turn-helix domain-containing protein n=1 Tax=Evansella sp. AB-P1 TaxID=3037653 RepID=UPI00241D244F|nr:helix-turn-helix domain-containing protein [Evansella sp. AB-P1]MDG5786722.1 helix-turn-helix domain-containing protein [Evansella sp. AB-P1]